MLTTAALVVRLYRNKNEKINYDSAESEKNSASRRKWIGTDRDEHVARVIYTSAWNGYSFLHCSADRIIHTQCLCNASRILVAQNECQDAVMMSRRGEDNGFFIFIVSSIRFPSTDCRIVYFRFVKSNGRNDVNYNSFFSIFIIVIIEASISTQTGN